jgi:hypothetical protein
LTHPVISSHSFFAVVRLHQVVENVIFLSHSVSNQHYDY